MYRQLKSNEIYKESNLSYLNIKTSEELPNLEEKVICQNRAKESIRFGLSVEKYGYHIFCSGNLSSKRTTLIKEILEEYAAKKKIPNDLCFIHNFEDEKKPILISLPAKMGYNFKKDMDKFCDELEEKLINLFNTSDYKKEYELLNQRHDIELETLYEIYNAKLKDLRYTFVNLNGELTTTPLSEDGRILTQDEFDKLDKEEKTLYTENAKKIEILLVDFNHKQLELEDLREDDLSDFDEEYSFTAIEDLLNPLIAKYVPLCKDLEHHFNKIKADILENLSDFKDMEKDEEQEKGVVSLSSLFESADKKDLLEIYKVNLFVDNKDLDKAPIIFAEEIDEQKLFGHISFDLDKNVAITNFTNIIAGDLIKANGGYLVIEAEELFKYAGVWDRFILALKNQKLTLSTKQFREIIIGETLTTNPIDLDLKVILIGDHELHYLLSDTFPVFNELFGIHAMFDTRMKRTQENEILFLQFIGDFIKRNKLKPFDLSALERVLEYASRLTDEQNELPLKYNHIYKILNESDAWANISGKDIVSGEFVQKAIDKQYERVCIYDEYTREMMLDGSILMKLNGKEVGQVNGLVYMDLDGYSIGKPTTITANTFRGVDGIISVDREVEVTGPIYNKAIEIIKGFLGKTFAQEHALSLKAVVSFEQSYSGIEGDSATVAELISILSDMSGIPVKQNFAITGSMNQKGDVQVIGGVNEKIEGFHEICKLKEPDKIHAVIIPEKNVQNLMLNEKVRKDIDAGTFEIYAVTRIEEVVELIMDISYDELIKTISEKLHSLQKLDLKNK